MIQKCKSFFHNSPLMILLSLVMAVSFLSFPVHVKAAENNTIVFYDTDVTVQNTIGSSSSGYNYASLGLYPTASSGYSGQIQVSSSSSTIYVVTNKDTGESCYARGFSASSKVCIPLVVYTNDDILTFSDKSDIINQINTTIKTYYDYLYTLINGKFTNLQTSLDASFAGISSDITIAKSAIVSAINSQTTTLQGNLNTQTSSLNTKIDTQTQVLLDAINNSQINPLFLKSFPSSTGMSYSTIVKNVVDDSCTLDLSCVKLSDNYYKLRYNISFNYVNLSAGSYLLKILYNNNSSSSGPNQGLPNFSNYRILNVLNIDAGHYVTAFDLRNEYFTTIYFDNYSDNIYVDSMFFDVYIYSAVDIIPFTSTHVGGCKIFRADDNLMLSTLQSIANKSDSNTQKEIDAANANTQKEIDAANTNSQNEINAANANTQKEINAANTNSQNEINAANANTQKGIDNANKNANDIMHSYDSTGQDDKNKEFADSQKELQDAEDSLFSSASDNFKNLDFSKFDLGVMPGMTASLSFVSGFLQSVYVKMGDFGTIFLIGLAVMIASKVIGLYRFGTGDG